MILTVTLNPIIEQRLHFSKVLRGEANRAHKQSYYAGGKGINVSRQLTKMGVKNLALTFLGGDNGRRLRATMTAEGLNFTAVAVKSETRNGITVIEDEPARVTHLFGENSVITPEEVNEFKFKLEKMIQNCEYVVFSGSSPSPACDDIFAYGIQIAEKYDKTAVLDTYGKALELALNERPAILHINKQEASDYFGKKIEDEVDIISALEEFNNLGVKIGIISDGDSPVYMNHFGFVHKITPPEVKVVDETGSGDAFVAGLVYGLYNDEILTDILRMATSCGAANAGSVTVCEVDYSNIEHLLDEILIEPIGKKLNLMNEML